MTTSVKPPDLEIRRRVDALRQHGHTNQAVGKTIEEYESKYGNIETHLINLDYVSVDTGYLYHQQADGSFIACLHNVLEGSLATALERGFIFAAPNMVEKQKSEEVSSERGNSYKSGYKPIQPQRPYKCDSCKSTYAKESRLKKHKNSVHKG